MEQEFSVKCNNCGGEVNSWYQNIHYSLTAQRAEQGVQTIYLSCGCVVDFPTWKIDLETGECKIINFAGKLFIEFMDDEMLMEDDDE